MDMWMDGWMDTLNEHHSISRLTRMPEDLIASFFFYVNHFLMEYVF